MYNLSPENHIIFPYIPLSRAIDRRRLVRGNPTGRAGEINEFAGLAGMVLAVADDTELARSRACGGLLEFEPPAEYPIAVAGGDNGVVAPRLVEEQRLDFGQLL